MPAKNPRLTAVLEKPLYEWLKKTAQKEGASLSTRVRDLLKQAQELEEDAYWIQEGEKRLKTFRAQTARSHQQVWRKRK